MAQGKKWTEEGKEKIVQSLKPYFLLNYSAKQACILANFPPSTFYEWIEKDETLRTRIEAWQGSVSAKAREVVAKEIQSGNIQQSNWWLERREKKHFSTRQEQTGADGQALIPGEKKEKFSTLITSFLGRNTKNSTGE